MSDNKEDFYIGYLPNAPKSYTKVIRTFIILAGILFLVLGLTLVQNQEGFRNGTFELGQLTQIEGTLVYEPFPMLKISAGGSDEVIKSILLIGFGKFGAEATIEEMEQLHGSSLVGKKLTLEGTLIYYDNKTLFELTGGTDALIAVAESEMPAEDLGIHGTQTIIGEIADPKCFFGVMKPGEGKPHRSCAIRCISGGIPPVLKATNQEGVQNYFLLTGPNGAAINDQILDKIGIAVEVKGQITQKGDWLYLSVDPNADINPTHKELLGQITSCSNRQLAEHN